MGLPATPRISPVPSGFLRAHAGGDLSLMQNACLPLGMSKRRNKWDLGGTAEVKSKLHDAWGEADLLSRLPFPSINDWILNRQGFPKPKSWQ